MEKKMRTMVTDVLASTLLLSGEGTITEKFGNEASDFGPQMGANFRPPNRPPKRCPPTVGGHLLGGLFWVRKSALILGPPFGRVQEKACDMDAANQRLLCLSLRMIHVPIRSPLSLSLMAVVLVSGSGGDHR